MEKIEHARQGNDTRHETFPNFFFLLINNHQLR